MIVLKDCDLGVDLSVRLYILVNIFVQVFLGRLFLNGNLDLHFTVKSKEIRLNTNSEHFNAGDG